MIYTNDIIKKIHAKRAKRIKIIKILCIPIMAIIILLACYIGYFKFIKKDANISFLGYRQYIVMTGSMEPNYNIGDLVIGKNVDQENIKINDVITYVLENGKDTVTHRVIDIVEENGEILYQTKGDNNNSPDTDLVKYETIQGKVIFKIDKLGEFILEFVTGTGFAIILLFFILSYMHTNMKEEKRIAREDARRRYNFPRYIKGEYNVR